MRWGIQVMYSSGHMSGLCFHCGSVVMNPVAIQEWSQSCSVLYESFRPHGLHSPLNSPGQNTGVGNLSLFQGIFPTQGWNPGFPHCRRILYQLSHKASPRILEWVAYPFSSRFSQPGNRTRVSCIAGGYFTNWVEGSPVWHKSRTYLRLCWEERKPCPVD